VYIFGEAYNSTIMGQILWTTALNFMNIDKAGRDLLMKDKEALTRLSPVFDNLPNL